MDEEEEFMRQVLVGIAESDVISIFFPLLRRALVVDTRHDETTPQLVKVMPQVTSMEQRIAGIERLRPQLGKVRSIQGIPWIRSVRGLQDLGIIEQVAGRLVEGGMAPGVAAAALKEATDYLWRLESLSYVRMIRGEGFKTIWPVAK